MTAQPSQAGLSQVVAAFEAALRAGQSPRPVDFLSRPDDTPALIELLHVELEFKLKNGREASVADYLLSYPQLRSARAAVVDLLKAEYEFRRRRAPKFARDEFLARYPAYVADMQVSTIHSQSDTGDFTTRSAGEPTSSALPGYEILETLGRGGMGVVYKARQTSINRIVALKMILSGQHASEQELSRFRSEAEAVAGLAHPHVVQLFEYGTQNGLPYFTLEFMAGGSLGRRIKEQPLDFREAAAMVEQLARGVAAAHARSIIHRDLKPDNILLATDGTPKIADFGLAKQAAADGEEMTQSGAVVGTPSYMAPEQARGDKNIGPATDIWALGAILYRVVTGRPPFVSPSSVETIRQVIETDPPSPSTLVPKLPRDIETICLKCLWKDPNRRYGSAEELADDLRRFLHGEPIRARPVGSLERSWKWTKRHRGLVAATSAVFLALTVGTGIAVWQAAIANKARADAVTEKETAVEEKVTADATAQFVIEVLTQASPRDQVTRTRSFDSNLTVREALKYAEPKIAERFAGRPILEIRLRRMLGDTYYALGDMENSASHLRRALDLAESTYGPESAEAYHQAHNLADPLRELGQYDAALAFARRALAGREAVFGPDHQYTLQSINQVASVLHAAGEFVQAESHAQRALIGLEKEVGPDHPDTLSALDQLARISWNLGKPAESEAYSRRLMTTSEKHKGPDHPLTLRGLELLGEALCKQAKYDEGEAAHVRVLATYEKLYGANNRETLVAVGRLADVYRAQGLYDKAEPLFLRAIEGKEKAFGHEHEQTLVVVNNYAYMLYQREEFAKAEPLFARSLVGREKQFGVDNPKTLDIVNNLASVYLALGKMDRAESMFIRALAGDEKNFGPEHEATITSASNLAALYFHQGKYEEATQTFARLLRMSEKVIGPDHPDTISRVFNLAVACQKTGDYDRAETLFLRAIHASEKNPGPDHPATISYQGSLGQLYLKRKQYEKAEPLLRRAWEVAVKSKPEDWKTFDFQSKYGDVLLGLKKPGEAEPLLRSALARLYELVDKIPASHRNGVLRSAANRLARLCDATNKADEAKKWWDEAAKYPELAPMPRVVN